MADIENQTDEAMGWAAEGKKLAVDIPEVSFRDAATFVAEMTPIVGDAMAAKEVYDELQKDEPNYYLAGALGGATLIGLIPGVGDIAAKAIRKGAKEVFDVAKRVEVDPNAMGSGLGNVKLKPKTDDILSDATSDAVDDLGFTPDDLSSWKETNYAKDKFRIPPDDEMAAAATNLREGKLSSEEFRALSNEIQPIKPITEMPKFPTKEEVVQALHATDPRKTKKGVIGINKTIEDGAPISARLDIPAYNNTDTWVVSLHDGSTAQGKSVGYGQTAVLNDVNFTSNSLAASSIATGKPKATIARMQGSWQNVEPEEVYKTVENLFDDPEWAQVGMNPYRASYFYDKADGMPVVSADQVMQVGPLVFAKKAVKTTPDDPRFAFEIKSTGVKANFNEGGIAMDDQTVRAFALGGLAEDVDPVSGNEVPVGSMPEEVRDDIPAQLSEGEYVVPADVVRFFGVKFFEDIRAEAKQGFAQMESNGRVGGEPVNGMEMGGDELPFDISELQMIDDGEPEQSMMYQGGYVSGYAGGGGVINPLNIGNTAPSVEYRTYTNAEGEEITIMYFNGLPMSMVPEGYTSVKEQQKATSEGRAVTNANYVPTEQVTPTREDSGQNSVKVFEQMREDQPEAVNYKELSASEIAKMVDEQKSLTGDAVSTVMGVVNPFLGVAVKAAMWHQSRQVEKELARRIKDTEISARERTQYSDILKIAQADKQGLLSKIKGVNEVPSAVDLITDQKKDDVIDAVEEALAYDPDVTAPEEVDNTVVIEDVNPDAKWRSTPTGWSSAETDEEADEVASANAAIFTPGDIRFENVPTPRGVPDSPRLSDSIVRQALTPKTDDGLVVNTYVGNDGDPAFAASEKDQKDAYELVMKRQAELKKTNAAQAAANKAYAASRVAVSSNRRTATDKANESAQAANAATRADRPRSRPNYISKGGGGGK